MNAREKLLAAAVAALAALLGLTQGWDKYQAALERNRGTERNVAQQLSTARAATARGRRAQQKLSQWKRQSLPTDPDIAKSLYQDWLQQQLTAAGLKVKELNILSSRTSSTSYQQLSFAVNATGKLDQLTDFLYRFYSARHLHRISRADFSPTEGREALKITLTVDAISLAETDRKDKLAAGSNGELKLPIETFRDDIVGRNLFAVYKRGKQQAKDAGLAKAEDTEASQAKVSGINYGADGWQMSVRMQKSGKVFYFRQGDKIKIGRFEGTIEELDGEKRQVIVSSGSRRLLVRLGETLSEAQPIEQTAS